MPHARTFFVLLLVTLVSVSRSTADGFGFQAFMDAFNGVSPASPCVAAGPNHLVAVSNNGIRFFTKNGQLTYDNTFSGSQGFIPGGGTPFHPQTLFDPHAQRFVVAAYYTFAFDDLISVAISDDDNPNGAWHIHTINVNSANGVPLFQGDRMTLGVGPDAVFVHQDFLFLGNPQDPFSHGFIFAVDKTALMQGQTPAVIAVEPFQFPISFVPARAHDESAPAQYFVTPFGTFAAEDKIKLFALQDPFGSGLVSTIDLDVPQYDFVTAVSMIPHAGGAIKATDSRMRRAVYRDGSLWTAHHIIDSQTGRFLARWYEVRMNGWPVSGMSPEIGQSGEVDLGPGVHTFLPDVTPDASGNAVLVFNRSSASTQPALMRALRNAKDAPGVVGGVELLRGDEVPLQSQTYAAGSSADVDPVGLGWVGGPYWTMSQFGGKHASMWVNTVALPAACPADLNGDGKVDQSDLGILLSAFGTCPGEPGHHAAAGALGGDPCVTQADLGVLLAFYGETCP